MTDEKQVVVYDITDAAIAKMEDLYMGLTVSGPDDEAGFKSVHKARKVVKTHRVSVEKRRKELKADALAWGRKVDGEANRIKDLLEPIESHLTAQEKIVTDEKKRQEEEAARLFEEKIMGRMNALAGFDAPLPYQKVAIMSDEEFEATLTVTEGQWKAEQSRIANEKRIEAERKAAEDAARKAEDERLEKIRAEQEKQMAEIKAQQERYAAAMKAENDKIQAEKDKIAVEKAEIKAEQDRIEREKAIEEAEERARVKAVADMKARVEREKKEAEEKAAAEKAEAERVAALLPDKEKAIKWVELMRDSIPKRPSVKDGNIASMIVNSLHKIKEILDELHRDIEEA